jgi:hypothetical protein
VAPHTRDTFVLADGRHVEHDIGRSWIRVSGRAEVTLIVFGEPDALPLGRRLVPVPGLLMEFVG